MTRRDGLPASWHSVLPAETEGLGDGLSHAVRLREVAGGEVDSVNIVSRIGVVGPQSPVPKIDRHVPVAEP
eukprot:CAMPEP_0181449584 /NCGR_PEP_ID=MMETSP1110-20121109/27734_1 /TAXON_ID=174948 /ORGANISM="Symbiodinium sp., Strain CCMP421" /LENGTH=70 /DNA_ID=CAMNT_0023573775 /DNA_START=227 /DNA_END=439 /DNA_ORIENTATION=+